MAGTIPPADAMTVKGTVLKAAAEYVRHRADDDGWARVVEAVDQDTRKIVSGLLLPSSRYPLQHLVAVCEATDRIFGRGDLRLCWEIGEFAADYEVNMLHKVFLRVASLDYWFRIAGSAWRSYYSHGTLRPSVHGTSGTLTLSDFNPISKAVCYRFGGWVRRVVEMTNASGVTMQHTACVLDGADACVWQGSWRR